MDSAELNQSNRTPSMNQIRNITSQTRYKDAGLVRADGVQQVNL